VLICDKDMVVAASVPNKKEYMDMRISKDVENIIEGRRSVMLNGNQCVPITEDEDASDFVGQCISPILTAGDVTGAVIVLSKDKTLKITDAERKFADAGARFMGSQIE